MWLDGNFLNDGYHQFYQAFHENEILKNETKEEEKIIVTFSKKNIYPHETCKI